MNGRMAKRLRKKAELLTVGQPKLAYDEASHVLAKFARTPRGIMKISGGSPLKMLGCTRKVYKALKREFKT